MKILICTFMALIVLSCSPSNKSGGSSQSEMDSIGTQDELARQYVENSKALIAENRHQINRVLGPQAADSMMQYLLSSNVEVGSTTYASYGVSVRGVSISQNMISIDPEQYQNYMQQVRTGRRGRRFQPSHELMHELVLLVGYDDTNYYFSSEILRQRR